MRWERNHCEFCGLEVHNGYITKGDMFWCSQRHYLAWLNEQQRWDDESINSGVVRDPGPDETSPS